jgi:hypothetical protein
LKPESKFTLLVFAISVIWKMTMYLSGLDETFVGKYPLLLVFGLLLIGMFRAVDARRKTDFPGGVVFMPAFRTGMSVAVLFTLLYSLFIYIYVSVIDLSFREDFIAKRVEELKKNNTPQADINVWLKSAEDFPFAMVWVLFTFIGLMVIGVFYAAAIARMMSRKYPVKQGLTQMKLKR